MFPEVERALRPFAALGCAHWVAGGWAIDLFLGRRTRPHKDVEIALARDDQARLLRLPGLASIERGARAPWRGERLELPAHQLLAHFADGADVEVLLNEFDASDWIYRRDPSIRLSRSRFDALWLPPEVVLLYKSKDPRPEDDQDFAAAFPHLAADQRRWLLDAIGPRHRWLA